MHGRMYDPCNGEDGGQPRLQALVAVVGVLNSEGDERGQVYEPSSWRIRGEQRQVEEPQGLMLQLGICSCGHVLLPLLVVRGGAQGDVRMKLMHCTAFFV